ncbi:MAG: SIMPL domain-containing protein [Planctomycetota bacterium]
MDRFIEVSGEGSSSEKARRYIAEISIFDSSAESQGSTLAKAWEAVLTQLETSDISGDEIAAGGRDSYQPWYRQENSREEGKRCILLRVADLKRLKTALDSLSATTFGSEQVSMRVQLRSPEYAGSVDAQSAALAEAFKDARLKAEKLARTMSSTLGGVLKIEEGPYKLQKSILGDASDDSTSAALCNAESVRREVWATCRVRFALRDT